MRVERLPGLSNVVRFPVERRARPTMALLRSIAPDVREVLLIAEAFGMQEPAPDLRDRVDAATAEHILNHFAGDNAFLDGLLAPVLKAAIAACRAAHDASLEASDAQHALLRAQTAGQTWLDPLRERAGMLTERAAELLLQAHARTEETEGVARAVGLARSNTPWTPRDHDAEDEALIAFGAARRTG